MEEIVVTGSRIVRNGYDQPTPVTVIGTDEIETASKPNLAQFVQQLPSVVASSAPATTNAAISDGRAGISSINLRGLGDSRTLVLLDGRRTVGSTITGTVDVNTFPQGLVRSVEIVTGGASAAYGSDAVSGVANFILDKTYTGFKASIEGGETTYGDDENYKFEATAGMAFMDGRGHFLLSGELMSRAGVFGTPNRDWNTYGWNIITNPAYAVGNGAPEFFIGPNSGPSLMTPGGIITNTALRGTYFGLGGSVNQLKYGATRDPDMIGGDWKITEVNDTQSLHSREDRGGIFGRLSYDVMDNLNVYFQGSWNRDAEIGWGGAMRNEGGVTIRTDNAFLPASVRAQAQALGLAQFTLGTSNGDLMPQVGNRRTDNTRAVQRYLVGVDGNFGLFGADWKWDASYQIGISKTHEQVGTTHNDRLALAQDAIFAPAGNAAGVSAGTIICRSRLTNPNNGCIPFNRLGVGVNSLEAINYVLGYIYREQTFRQNVAVLNFSTAFDNPWFQPIGLAFGVETRREAVSGYVPPGHDAGWFTGNYLPTFGSYNVTEGYAEVSVPVTSRIELSAAVRKTHYSESGGVLTWKGGVSWNVIDDLRLRATRSRDIRAPNLSELFAAGTRRTNTLIDPFNANASVQFLENTTGNLALEPEVADTLGLGAVYRPSFVPGLGFSVDYYDIKIDGAIGTLSAQAIVNRCFAGVQTFCDAVVRGVNNNGQPVISQVNASPFNFTKTKARGIDFEASYTTPLERFWADAPGTIALRGMATRYIHRVSDDGASPPNNSVGQNASGNPKWVYRASVTYSLDRVRLAVTGRGFSSGVYDNSYIVCTSACPASTVFNRTVNLNSLPGALYFDTNITYQFSKKYGAEMFFNVSNLFNKDPAIVAQGVGGGAHIQSSTAVNLYDFMGRTFRAGVRFEL